MPCSEQQVITNRLSDIDHSISDKDKLPVDTDDTDDEGVPQISLAEMLDDLHIGDDATGEEGAAMMD